MIKRFLFVLPSLDPGGAERNIVALASHMSRWAKVDLAVVRLKGELRDDDQLADVQLPNGVDGPVARLRGK